MASAERPPRVDLTPIDGLDSAPFRFDPFEALRRLECAHPERPRLGESAKPAEDAVRLRQNPSLRFAPAALEEFAAAEGSRPATLTQVFFGVFGPNGPLPLHLTEYAFDRLRNANDPTLARFADIFHHRLLSLLYRAWATSRPVVSADRPAEDRFPRYVDSLFGLGQDTLLQRDAWPDAAKRFFAGWLACAARPPEGLEAMLVDFFGLPIRVEEYAAEWLPLGPEVSLRLGVSGVEPRATGGLGIDTIVGEVCWSAEHRFRIVAGPLGLAEFDSLLPLHGRLEALGAIVRNYTSDELAWELRLIVRAPEVPEARLGIIGSLGWNSWLAPDGRAPGVVTLRPRPASGTH